MSAIIVRRLLREEHALLREARLDALRGAPDAFAETVEEALARDEAWWRELAASVTAPSVQAAFVAEVDGRVVGMVFALEDRMEHAMGRLGGLWVAPSVRRAGVGAALFSGVRDWARALGKRGIRLWAVAESPGEALYRRVGFSTTGTERAFPGHESRRLKEWQLDL